MSRSKNFKEHFYGIKTKFERNMAILSTYLDGYLQANIATCLSCKITDFKDDHKWRFNLCGINFGV